MRLAQYTWSIFLWRCDGDGLFSKQWVMFFRHIFLTLSQLGPSPESGTFLQALWSSPWHIVHVHWFISIFSKLNHHRYLLREGLLRSIFLSDLCSISRFSPWVIRFHTILFPRVYLSKYLSGIGPLITFSGLPSPLRNVRYWPIPSSASDFKQKKKNTRESARAAIAMLKITQIFHCHALWYSWILVFQIKFYRVTHNFG